MKVREVVIAISFSISALNMVASGYIDYHDYGYDKNHPAHNPNDLRYQLEQKIGPNDLRYKLEQTQYSFDKLGQESFQYQKGSLTSQLEIGKCQLGQQPYYNDFNHLRKQEALRYEANVHYLREQEALRYEANVHYLREQEILRHQGEERHLREQRILQLGQPNHFDGYQEGYSGPNGPYANDFDHRSEGVKCQSDKRYLAKVYSKKRNHACRDDMNKRPITNKHSSKNSYTKEKYSAQKELQEASIILKAIEKQNEENLAMNKLLASVLGNQIAIQERTFNNQQGVVRQKALAESIVNNALKSQEQENSIILYKRVSSMINK